MDSNILSFDNVVLTFCNESEPLLVLDHLNFTLKKGEILAIIGPSGCGKSTILNLVSGLLRPDSGKIQCNGSIGYMFQRDNLFEWRTIYQNILLGLEINRECTKENLEKVDRLIKAYGLEEFRNRYPRELSGGMRQRVALIRTLAISPDILLLDEAFASLDYQTKWSVIEDIDKILHHEKKSTILVTHDISEAIALSDHILILTPRPCHIRHEMDIQFYSLEDKSPLKKLSSKEYGAYFEEIWKYLHEL